MSTIKVQQAQPAAGPEGAAVKRFAVLAAAAALSTWAFDLAATQVGLPSMQATLGISVTASQWILNITLMFLAGAATVGGVLGDRLGRIRMFRIGILLLMAGAAVATAGGLLGQYAILLAGRAIEGLGAACAGPVTAALLVDVFGQSERGAAQGRMVAMQMLVAAFAPLMAGLIIQVLGWPYAYLMTVAGGLVTLQLARRVRYTQIKPPAAPFDYAGAVLVFLAVSMLTTGIMQSTVYGLTSTVILLLIGAGLLAGLVLVLVSLRKANPLLQFDLLKIRNVAIAVLVTAMRVLPNLLMSVFVARYAQQVLGLSPTVTGLLLVLPPLAQVAAAPVAGRMLDRAGPRLPVSLGAGLQLAGLVLLAVGFPAQQIGVVLAGAVVGVAGFAFTNPVQMAALNQAPLGQRGMVAGIFPLAGQFGTALWVALLTAGLSAMMAGLLTTNPGAGEATAQAQALGWLAWISAGLTLIPLAAARLLGKGPAQPA